MSLGKYYVVPVLWDVKQNSRLGTFKIKMIRADMSFILSFLSYQKHEQRAKNEKTTPIQMDGKTSI